MSSQGVHLFLHSSFFSKLFPLPSQPPYRNSSHSPVSLLKKNLGMAARQGPITLLCLHTTSSEADENPKKIKRDVFSKSLKRVARKMFCTKRPNTFPLMLVAVSQLNRSSCTCKTYSVIPKIANCPQCLVSVGAK